MTQDVTSYLLVFLVCFWTLLVCQRLRLLSLHSHQCFHRHQHLCSESCVSSLAWRPSWPLSIQMCCHCLLHILIIFFLDAMYNRIPTFLLCQYLSLFSSWSILLSCTMFALSSPSTQILVFFAALLEPALSGSFLFSATLVVLIAGCSASLVSSTFTF